MKKVTDTIEVSVKEALQLLEANEYEPVDGLIFSDNTDLESSHTKEGLIAVCIGNGVAYPFRVGSPGKTATTGCKHCFKRTERWPNETPEGVPDLPHPWLAYVGEVKLPRDSSENIWGFAPDIIGKKWTPHWSGVGLNFSVIHYAIDVRTPHAKKHFPEMVEAMEYRDRTTPEHWFNTCLPKDYAELTTKRHLEQLYQCTGTQDCFAASGYTSFSDAFTTSFAWVCTPEGFEFWHRVNWCVITDNLDDLPSMRHNPANIGNDVLQKGFGGNLWRLLSVNEVEYLQEDLNFPYYTPEKRLTQVQTLVTLSPGILEWSSDDAVTPLNRHATYRTRMPENHYTEIFGQPGESWKLPCGTTVTLHENADAMHDGTDGSFIA